MRTRRTAVLLFLIVAGLASAASAQQGPRERRVDPLTASIAGRVTSETGGAIRRAEIRAISESGLTRFATSDNDGRYVVRDLPEGTFTLHVSKSGFVPLYFGQRRPFERRATIRVAQGQRGTADVRLPRAGAIAGRIVDRFGEPVLGARVQALQRRMVQGQRGLQSVGIADTTDDTGAYRLYGLPPGDYYLTATPRRIEDRAGRPAAGLVPGRGAPIFYPGTANRDLAQRVTVDVSGEARADLQLVEVPTARVTGVVLTSDGSPAAGAMVTLLSRDLDIVGGAADGMGPLRILDDAAADGTFELTAVPPGSFTLVAQTRPQITDRFDIASQRIVGAIPATPPGLETASLPITVDGDVGGVTLSTRSNGTADVVVVADQGVTAPLPSARIVMRGADRTNTVTILPAEKQGRMSLSLAPFTSIAVEGLPEEWMVKAIMLDDEDVTDKALDVRNSQGSVVRVILTDRLSSVAGSISTGSFADAGPPREATIVVFAGDESKWTYPSRFIRSVRVNENGTYQLAGLPPHPDYRAVAVDYLDEGEETDPEFLKRMRERATRFGLGEGERRTVDVRLMNR